MRRSAAMPTALLAAILALLPAAAGAQALAGQGLSDFTRENLASFTTFSLSNGLPVVVKRNLANRVQHISLVVRGGSAASSPDKAGYEALALRTMARGSRGYSYSEIQALLDETSSRMGSSSSFDYSTYGLTTLDKYLDRLLPLWVDSLVAPSFSQADFDQELSQSRLALHSMEQNPWSRTGLAMNDLLFAGHPYAVSPEGSEESLAKASLADIKAWYAARINAASLFVVAVGNFDPVRLRGLLEKGLGSLPRSGAVLPPPAGPIPGRTAASLTKVEFPQSKGMGYLRGDFPAPSPADPDFMPLSLGMKLLSELLFNVVRDKYGAVYSPSAFIRDSIANYGSVSLFKTKMPGKAKAYIDEALAILASGRAVAVDPENSADGYSALAEVLEAAKAQYINEAWESQATNASIAARIALSLVTTGDFANYLYEVDRIRAVSPAQVGTALAKYFLPGKLVWVALGSSDVLDPIRDGDFAGFGPAR
jgi:zinc protease